MMPRIVIAIAFAFLLERATSQMAPTAECTNAINQQQTDCNEVTDICTGDCAIAYQAVMDNCTADVSLIGVS